MPISDHRPNLPTLFVPVGTTYYLVMGCLIASSFLIVFLKHNYTSTGTGTVYCSFLCLFIMKCRTRGKRFSLLSVLLIWSDQEILYSILLHKKYRYRYRFAPDPEKWTGSAKLAA